MPEDRYNDLIVNGRKIKRFSYLNEAGEYVQKDIRLKKGISAPELNSFFTEIYKGTRYFYTVTADRIIDFFKSLLNSRTAIDLTPLYKVIMFQEKGENPNKMLLQFCQNFLEMFEVEKEIRWDSDNYNLFILASQKQPKLQNGLFLEEQQAMLANSGIVFCMKQLGNEQLLENVTTKIRAKNYTAQARR